jgi:two-component system, OmpR family, phosphate regulon sensor histidine kinase PhoR
MTPNSLSRLVLALALGSLAGMVIGAAAQGIAAGAAAGALLGVLVSMAVDTRRGLRLLEWLRQPDQRPAPSEPGFWGELTYRIDRALRQKELAVEQERQRLTQFLAAVEASPNGVLLLDANDQIEWCSAVAAQHLGLDPTRDRLQRMTNLVRSPILVAHLQGGAFAEPVTFDGPVGRTTLSLLVRPYGDGMKLLLTQDITDRERAEAMRRDFVANVSHEIRTPLTVLAGFVETLAQLPLSEPERRRVYNLMAQQTGRMQSLVADLLTLAQLEGSPRPAPDRWLPLEPLLKRALHDAQALSSGRHQVSAHASEALDVAGSESELFSAVANLMGNAVRYTPEGGHVQLSTGRMADGRAFIEVVDDGPGIAREHLPRLTERFYRVDGSRSRDTGGTGLGLAIVKHVIQRHGGEIDVQSELGKGSTFRLVLPALRVRHATRPIDLLTEAAD